MKKENAQHAGTPAYTPGPWGVVKHGDFTFIEVADGGHIASVGSRGNPPNYAEHTANASLIAAAPDLLDDERYIESLLPSAKDLADYDDGELIEVCITVKAIKDIRAAIAKAEGR